MIRLEAKELEEFTLVEIKIDGIAKPDDLRGITVPQVDCKKGVVLSGRAPIWVFGSLVHEFHPTAWVATFDPRLGGAVVVESHCSKKKVGDVIKID